jgi:hypothetical protein
MTTQLPIACTLDEAALRERRSGLLAEVGRCVVERRETEDGFAFRFLAEDASLGDIARVIDLERQCCTFLRFRLTVEPGGGPVWLDRSGPAGTKEYLRGLLGIGQ